ncbi:MAG: hypothetical protein ACI9DK_000044 [Vicingaceae bacterium]|jgi:hypothetical protein
MQMKLKRFSVFLLVTVLFSTAGFSQKILVFDKSGKVKRVRYYEGEYISLQKIDKQKLSGVIQVINDSSFVLDGKKVTLNSVQKVYNTQKGIGYQLGANIFIIPALGYVPLIVTNGLINNDSPIIKQSQLCYGAGFIGIAFIFGYLANRPFRISQNRPLKIIDISI